MPNYALHGRQLNTGSGGMSRGWEHRLGGRALRGLGQGGAGEGTGRIPGWPGVAWCRSAKSTTGLGIPAVRAVPWDQVFPFGSARSDALGADAYDFLRFTNTVDALLAAARIWPVTVVGHGKGGDYDGDWVMVEAAEDEARDRMAHALGLEPAARQMERAFAEEIGDVDGETAFNIVEEPRLDGQEPQAGRWIIQKATLAGGARRYVFQRVAGDPGTPAGAAFLRPVDLAGSYVLLQRRLKAIEALRDQTVMLRALEVPGSASRDTMEQFEEDAFVARLDCRSGGRSPRYGAPNHVRTAGASRHRQDCVGRGAGAPGDRN